MARIGITKILGTYLAAVAVAALLLSSAALTYTYPFSGRLDGNPTPEEVERGISSLPGLATAAYVSIAAAILTVIVAKVIASRR